MPRTYQKLFKQKAVMTNMNGKPLPLGLRVTSDHLVIFLAALPIMWAIELVIHIRGFWGFIFVFGGAGVAAWAGGKLDPAGKPLFIYLRDTIVYFFRPHASNGWDVINKRLSRRKGLNHRAPSKEIPNKFKVSWTDRDVPLPAVVRSNAFEFDNRSYVDVKLRKNKVIFRKAHKLRFNSRRTRYGLRPGKYRVEGKNVTKVK